MKLVKKISLTGIIMSCLLVANNVNAEFKVAKIFSDNMVLQRDMQVPVWGWAKPGEKVTVKFKEQKVSATAGADGKWLVRLKPFKADSNPAAMEIALGNEKKIFKNILVGDVWLCSGQSNMQFRLQEVPDAKKQIREANFPQIRLFQVENNTSDVPWYDIKSINQWQVCSPETASSFSAVGYFFGRKLYQELNVPIGLINSGVGATFAESWTSLESLQAEKALKPIFDRHIKMMTRKAFDKRVEQWRKDVEEWNKIPKAERRKRSVVLKWWRRIGLPYGYPGNHRPPGCLFNAMINPLVPFAFKGVIWYQGESNVTFGDEYGILFPTLIKDWRARWGQGDFPFYFVQIAPCHEFKGLMFTELWTAQYETAEKVSNCGMVSPIDYGDVTDPHPKEKEPVGIRLANLALTETYGFKDIQYQSPSFKKIKIEGDKIRVFFNDVSKKGLVSRDGKPLREFKIAGKDGKFYKAQAVIDGDTVLVSSLKVKNPRCVTFAWHCMAEPNLNDGKGLPVLPFSTGVN